MEQILKDYQAFLFDMDGTLVNTEPLKGKALAIACGNYGQEVDFNIYKDVMGESWSIVTDHFFKQANISPDLTDFNHFFRDHFERLLSENLKLNHGAESYIKHLKLSGKKCALVSSAATWMVDNILNALHLKDAFQVVITQERVNAHKPDPEAFNLALSQLGIKPEHALIFEDSNAGVAAGQASGCDVVAIRHEFNGNNDLSGAIACIETFTEMFA